MPLIGLLLIITDKVFVKLSANILINESGMVSNHTTLILPKNYEELTIHDCALPTRLENKS